jgi:uncharacterized LabA/DUF88 family protein
MAPAAGYGGPTYVHAPNAALLIDFDNVTMGIRSDLGNELRNLLSSDIIKGKVAVQRAYADWRRYPQYIVPLTEASIDLIYAPAYGSAKKNATDIRLAIDALEIVFTRPEIGTFILLSGDSDFSSLVIKLKEYGKYVIGVGIRESSSDLLVMNCDEYYSYNALAGLVRAGEDEKVSRDPWELVVEAAARMKRNGDVMRSDRLKQVMQDIDSSFDEKNLGMAKFSRFCQEAAHRGLIKLTRLDNGQMEVDVAHPEAAEEHPPRIAAPAPEPERAATEENGRRGRRGRRGGRERGAHEQAAAHAPSATPAPAQAPAEPAESPEHFAPPLEEPVAAPQPAPEPEMRGERLTRDEAFDLVRRAVLALTTSEDEAVPASAVRQQARELLGRDSESLNERFFHRILRDAHDADLIDLRKRGDDYEVAPAATAAPIAEQLAAVSAPAPEPSQAARSAANAAALRRGIRHRGGRGARLTEPPPELLSVGVVEMPPTVAPVTAAEAQSPKAAQATKAASEDTTAQESSTAKASTAAKETPAAKEGEATKGSTPRRTATKRGTRTAKTAKRAQKTVAAAPAAKAEQPKEPAKANDATPVKEPAAAKEPAPTKEPVAKQAAAKQPAAKGAPAKEAAAKKPAAKKARPRARKKTAPAPSEG